MRSGDWGEVDRADWEELLALAALLGRAIEPGHPERPAPLTLALKAQEMAQRLFAGLAGEERDLRQVITTLRTAHAVAWDMYDARQAERVTVSAHMARLRSTIDEFEADLRRLLEESPPAP